MSKEIRAFDFDILAEKRTEGEEDEYILTGTPIVFDEITELGWYKEKIDKNALKNTDLKDVRFLVNHNTDMIPLARSRNNNSNSTMQMEVTESGMNIRVKLDVDNNAEAKSLYSAVERGDITGMSFMFTVDSDQWEDLTADVPTRTILSIGKVFELSAVTFPAYEQTSIQARGLAEALESAKASLESAKAAEKEKRDAVELAKAKLRLKIKMRMEN